MAGSSGTEERIDSPMSLGTRGEPHSKIAEIDTRGDLVLRVEHSASGSAVSSSFRVSSISLQSHSKYFSRLLQGRFGESERVAKEHVELQGRFGDITQVPAHELPLIEIKDLGRISPVKSLEALCSDFLSILHGKELQSSLPVANLANLAIVADRFDALEAVRKFAEHKKIARVIDGKTSARADSNLTAEKVRQRLLVSILLGYSPWMDKYSSRMIVKGWVDRDPVETDTLWWDLPSRLEEELAFRRECILETLQSLQSHLISLYTSRERQCRLGYDSSAQCDSFQLGEMLRFFTRIGTMQVKGTLLNASEILEPFDGDIFTLVDALRQVPEYQIDKNHTHCGLRTRIIPLLDLLVESLHHVGMCGECWSQDRHRHAWMDTKRPLLWRKSTHRLRNQGHEHLHEIVRALFMAAQRDWDS